MDTATTAPPRRTADAPPAPRRLAALAVGLVLLVGVLVRLHSPSALWLDEALSVAIARVPLGELPAALRQDGAPPVYYVLLHGWTSLFGTGDTAVRALSVLLSLLCLPLAWQAGRRLHSPAAGWTAVLLLASSPFAVRYATETRMYSLVLLLVLLGVLALRGALDDPSLPHLAPVTGVAALLALTHYWSLFLLAVVGAGLLWAAVRGPRALAARRCLLALAAAGLLFLPWLPVFLFQSAHTGTPWAKPPPWDVLVTTWVGWSGPGLPGQLLGVLLLVLALGAPFLRPGRSADGAYGVLLRLPPQRLPLLLSGTAVLTLLLGVAATVVQSSGFALRYSGVALVPALLAATVALHALPQRARVVLLSLMVLLGTLTTVRLPFDDRRTQAPETAAAVEARLTPVDLVLYCPDQLGPAVARLLPPGTDQLVYPSGGRPERVDWVDYRERNRAGDPRRYAALAHRRTAGAIWLVSAKGYRTYGDSCQRLAAALAGQRGPGELVQKSRTRYAERQTLQRFPPRA